ncbi:MAG: putative sugar nucleotidyl transferase [Nitrososphaerota archaeon]
MQLGVFEDRAVENFHPIADTRPAYMLLLGTTTLLTKIVSLLQPVEELHLFTRPELAELLSERVAMAKVNIVDEVDGPILLVNGLLIPDKVLVRKLRVLRVGQCVVKDGRMVAAHLHPHKAAEYVGDLATHRLPNLSYETLEYTSARLITYPWELIEMNAEMILNEFAYSESAGMIDSGVRVYGDARRLYVGEKSEVEFGSVIDVRNGPVHIGRQTVVRPFSRLEGPLWIGDNCIVDSCILKGGTSLGDWCRVGGEVEASVFQGFSNKRHTGYLGHSYVGEWVNIGAGTNVSNLKNTYGTHRMRLAVGRVDTGRTFLGCFLGDHVKTGIGTNIISAKRIGVSSHVYGYVKGDVPSFTAYSDGRMVEIDLNSALRTAKRMMTRRGVEMTISYARILQRIFEITSAERHAAGVSRGEFRP